MDRVILYEEVITYKGKPEVYLIDVRNPVEIAETGRIPASINIPLGELEATLEEGSEEFKKKYGRDMPHKDAKIVFSCYKGGRATKAMEAALNIGFVNAMVYKGGWNDWSSRVDV